MKEAQFALEFTSHVLANSINTNEDVDIFLRDSDDKLIFQQSWWYTAFNKAMDLTKLKNIKPSDINMDLSVDASTEIYSRRYGVDKIRKHEAIIPGKVITFNALVADHITKSSLENILDKMGKYVGLSPYGHNLGYGKFKVKSVQIEASEDF